MPMRGRLSGTVVCAVPEPVNVVLSHETGRRTATLACNGGFQFTSLVPGRYELSISTAQGAWGWFEEVSVGGRETRLSNISLLEIRPTTFETRPANAAGKLLVRRRDPASPGEVFEVKPGTTMRLAPGYWEVAGQFGDTHWLSRVQSAFYRPLEDLDSDWYVAFVQTRAMTRVVADIADGAGTIEGVVTLESNPAIAKPVFLLPVSESARRAVNGPKQMLTDGQGRFRFSGLAPGDYRLLSTDDMTTVEDGLMLGTAAKVVTLTAGSTQAVGLGLYRAP